MEKLLVLIKPGFSKEDVINRTREIIINSDLRVVSEKMVKYRVQDSMKHYKDKAKTSYYDELTNYLSSNYSYGFIVEGEDAIKKMFYNKENIRVAFPEIFNLKVDKMRNIIHTSDSVEKARNEIKIFKKLNKIH